MECTDGFSVWVESAERRSYADVRRFADGVTALRREPEENIAAAAACAAAFAAGLVTAAVFHRPPEGRGLVFVTGGAGEESGMKERAGDVRRGTGSGVNTAHRTNEREVNMTIQERALRDVLRERARQDEGWGEQNHDPQTYLSILSEEVGETAKEASDLRWWQANGGGRDDIRARLYEEAVQTAAVALAIVECLLRGKWRWPEQRERTELAEVLRMPNNELPSPDDHVLLMIEHETSGLWYVAGGYCREGARKKDGRYFTTTDGRMPFGRVVGWTPMEDAVKALGLATQPAGRGDEAVTAKEGGLET